MYLFAFFELKMKKSENKKKIQKKKKLTFSLSLQNFKVKHGCARFKREIKERDKERDKEREGGKRERG